MPVEETRYNQCFCGLRGYQGGWIKCNSCNWFIHFRCTDGLISPPPNLQKPHELSYLRCPWCGSVSKYEHFARVLSFVYPSPKVVDFYRRCFMVTRGYKTIEMDKFIKKIKRLARERARRLTLGECLPDPSPRKWTYEKHQQEQPGNDLGVSDTDEVGLNEQHQQEQSEDSSESEIDEVEMMNDQDHESLVNGYECSESFERIKKRISVRNDDFKRLKKENEELKKMIEAQEGKMLHLEQLHAATIKQYKDHIQHIETLLQN